MKIKKWCYTLSLFMATLAANATNSLPDYDRSERWFNDITWKPQGQISRVEVKYGYKAGEPIRARYGFKSTAVDLGRILATLEKLDQHSEWAPNFYQSFPYQDQRSPWPGHEAVKRQLVVIEVGPFTKQGIFSLHVLRREDNTIVINTFNDQTQNVGDYSETKRCKRGSLIATLYLTPDDEAAGNTQVELMLFVKPSGINLPSSAINRFLRDIAAEYINGLERASKKLAPGTIPSDPYIARLLEEIETP